MIFLKTYISSSIEYILFRLIKLIFFMRVYLLPGNLVPLIFWSTTYKVMIKRWFSLKKMKERIFTDLFFKIMSVIKYPYFCLSFLIQSAKHWIIIIISYVISNSYFTRYIIKFVFLLVFNFKYIKWWLNADSLWKKWKTDF